jgi:predicted phosphodiesterase
LKTRRIQLFAALSLAAAVTGLALACAPFRDSAYSDHVLHKERELNENSVEKIGPSGAVEADGKIRIAVLADSHQTYKDLDRVIRNINDTPDVDFVVNLGDVTNSGYNLEFDQFLGSYLDIQRPVFNVIGNHDALGAGPKIYKKVFGSPNFFFESDSHRYIFFHSANLEDKDGFDPQWLKTTVEASSKPVIIFTHAPLRDAERFTGDTAQIMNAVITNPKTQIVLNGHNHVYGYANDTGTVTIQCARPENGQWLLLEIQGTQLSTTRMESGAVEWATLKN